MRVLVKIFSIAALAGFCGFEILYHDGIVGQTQKPLLRSTFAAKGCFCHGDSANSGARVWISGPDTLLAGTRALYTINVAKDSNIAAGFDVAAFFGDLGIYDSIETQLLRVDPLNPVDSLELAHTDAKLSNGRDTISWSFWYRAPLTAGRIDTLYANGNSVDTSRDPSGDFWNFAPKFLVRITGTSSIAEYPLARSYRLMQNYPNPFNPSTIIRYELPVGGRVTLTVFDAVGREIRTLVNEEQSAGFHEATFNAANARTLASGIYFYRLIVAPSNSFRTPQFISVKKMLLLK